MGRPKLGVSKVFVVLLRHFFDSKTNLKLQQRNESYGGVLFVGRYVSQNQSD